MSLQTDFESLKQHILEVITKDPTVKYTLVGWVSDEFVPKKDYHQTLEEIKALREESNKRFESVDKRFEEAAAERRAMQEESNRRFESVDKRFEEAAAERRAMREDTQALREDMHAGFKKLTKQIDLLGSRWGRDSEQAFANALRGLLGDFFQGTVKKWRVYDAEGYVRGRACEVELDVVISNGLCIVIEIKSKPSLGDVTLFERTIRLYEQQTGQRPDRKVLIAYAVEPEAKVEAEICGMEIFDSDELSS